MRWFGARSAELEPLCFGVGWKGEWSGVWVGWCVTVTGFDEVSVGCFAAQPCVISGIENPGLWLGLDSASNESQALLPT